MINATAQPGTEAVRVDAPAAPIRRIGGRTFALLVLFEMALLAAVLAWVLPQIGADRTPYSNVEATLISDAVRSRLSGIAPDMLIEVQPGISARESNLRGFSYEGNIYYYYVEGAANYDPFSRGSIDSTDIEILLRDDSGPQTLVIYRIL